MNGAATVTVATERLDKTLDTSIDNSGGGRRLADMLAIVAQVGLVLWAMHTFRVEESFGLTRILPLIFVGFVVNAALPLRLRRSFFLFLSMIAIGVVFGIEYGLALIGLGLGLIAVCHLPIAFSARVALLVAVGAVLAGVRAEWIPVPFGRMPNLPTLVLPILGSMFMFRLAVYLYDLRHERKPASVVERLSYFFLLPNVCFPLFPVVDYQTYRRTYYDHEPLEIYRKGMLWIFRGMIHLLVYRIIYLYLVPAPADVQTLGGVVQAMVTTYMLYLRISGQFHLIIGILCLFGFNLPETHHLYLLATSFNDYWRRINIYWKDFMMKLFYYPSLMRARRLGMNTAMVIATFVVFAGTWLLHSYQWFWLRGTFPIAGPDALFWGILGCLVVTNSLYEAKRGRKRSLSKPRWSFRGALSRSAKTVGMLAVITVLWSLWSSASVGEWLTLLSAARNSGAGAFVLLLATLALMVLLGVLMQYVTSRKWNVLPIPTQPSLRRSAGFAGAAAMLLVLIGAPSSRPFIGTGMGELVAAFQENRLNERDAERLERGYYEGLLDSDRYATVLFSMNAPPPQDWVGMRASDVARQTADVLEYELIPSYQGVFKGAPFQANEWGMRDRPYAQSKPLGTFRIALLGASYEMGLGVSVDETFENQVETQLNRNHAGGKYDRYEIMNFSVGGYSVLQNLVIAERRLSEFEPDLVLFAIHSNEETRLRTHLRNLVQSGTDIPYPYVQDVIQQSGATAEMKDTEIGRRLDPYLDSVIGWSLEQVGATCRQQGMPCVSMFVPRTEEIREIPRDRFALLSGFAARAGLLPLSLDGAYGNHGESTIQLASFDTHPNPLGHRLLADRLYGLLQQNDDNLNLGLSSRRLVDESNPASSDR